MITELIISAVTVVAPHVSPHVSPRIAPSPMRVVPKPVPAPPIIMPTHVAQKCDDKKEKCNERSK